jgi:DivIVA domain-containing protein
MNDFRDLAEVEFEISRRGYDREEVDSYLRELRAELTRLRGLLDDTAEEPNDGSYPEPVQAELDRVSAEVEAIVGAAREAAEGLRTRAAAEASRWREEADADARRWRSEAETESTRLREDAEEASARLLSEAQEEASKRRSEADTHAARVREEADAYAHQTREVAGSAAAQLKEEADAYAALTRSTAEEESTELRESADAHANRVTSAADAYAQQTREAVDAEAAETRAAARADANEWRSDAEAESRRLREEADTYASEVRNAATAEAERMAGEAESAAAETRASAQEYSQALRQSADAETTRQRSEAMAAAETARASVWDEATAILDTVAREVLEARERGENDSLAIIADAEQQSHRMVSQARQSAEEQRRTARIEADRLIGDAQSQHDEIIETATRAAAAAQERAQALERRREELMGQLEKAQKAMRTLEEELETKRGSLRDRDVPADTSTVKVVQPPEPEELAGVKVIPSVPHSPAPSVKAEDIVDEVRTLREQRQSENGDSKPEREPEAKPKRKPERKPERKQEAKPKSKREIEQARRPKSEPESAQGKADAESGEAPASDIDALFANLRQAEDEPADPRRPRPTPGVDPDELRERLLLPLQNRAHREIKRQLTEQQNVALEQLRVSGADWVPGAAEHEGAFALAISELVVESARSGYLAARELGIRSDEPPALAAADLDVPVTAFAADLVDAVAGVLESSRSADETSRKTSGAVSRIYRSWRTDRAELRLREMSDVAYADALRVALRQEGVEDTEWALGDWAVARHAS